MSKNPEGSTSMTLDFDKMVTMDVMNMDFIENFFRSKFKVDNRANNFGTKVLMTVSGNTLQFKTSYGVPRRYYKFLLNKLIAKQEYVGLVVVKNRGAQGMTIDSL